jgi:hypothetical protein
MNSILSADEPTGTTRLQEDEPIDYFQGRKLLIHLSGNATNQALPVLPWLYRVATNACFENIFCGVVQASSEHNFQQHIKLFWLAAIRIGFFAAGHTIATC